MNMVNVRFSVEYKVLSGMLYSTIDFSVYLFVNQWYKSIDVDNNTLVTMFITINDILA